MVVLRCGQAEIEEIDAPDRVILHLPGFKLQGVTNDVTQVLIEGNGAEYFDLLGPYAGLCVLNSAAI